MANRQRQDANTLANKGKNDVYVNYMRKHEQMSRQQELIEQKKLEIQKRLAEKKKKETEDALQKLNEDKLLKASEGSRSKRNYFGFSKNKTWSGRDRPEESSPGNLPPNIFSNDGSFLAQFQKISGIKVEASKRPYSDKGNVETLNQLPEANNRDFRNENSSQDAGKEESQERKWISPNESHSPQKQYQPQTVHQQQQFMIQHQPPRIQQHTHNMPHQGMPPQPLHPPLYPPHHMQPPMTMNYPPQFNPMQCGMMLPPPMTPSSIPPPAPMNPGSIPSPSPLRPCSIPSPSPLQPCSIPSPSPLQPYAIPPPSPMIPHAIPPPSPMVPHSIPPPSPLTPHSIPPPLPLRPQSIPPPVQQPPLFLSLVPPPPPPPPKEDEPKVKPTEAVDRPKSKENSKPVAKKLTIEENVKDLFKNDDYSSSEGEDEKGQLFGPSNFQQTQSDSESETERKSPESNSDKESGPDSSDKEDSLSELDSEVEQEPVPITESESEATSLPPLTTVVIEDTQTQFPSDNKDSSNYEDPAPPDLSSEGDTLSGARRVSHHPSDQWQEDIKKEPEDSSDKYCGPENSSEIKVSEEMVPVDEALKSEIKLEVKDEVKYGPHLEVKSETVAETYPTGMTVKLEEPPVKKKRRSRWASSDDVPSVLPQGLPPVAPAVGPVGIVVPAALGVVNTIVPPPSLPQTVPNVNVPGMSGAMISKVTRSDPALVAYAMKAFGRTNLTDAEWKKAEDHYKINLLYQDMMRKREELERLQAAGRNKYEYDSDEETEGGTWEHRLRYAEMEATQLWADELTEQAKGKHHIGDFLPPDELARFMEKYEALKDGREPDLSDYKEFKLKEDNIGFQMLQKLGWTEGQGLGPDGSGIMDPVNKAMMRPENQGLGIERPDDVEADDDEYDAYRKRMMLAYRFRPNPMNNPRRPYY